MKLFEPFDFGGRLTIQNRVVLPPMVTRLATSDGEVTPELIERYVLYARGGCGLSVMEAIAVEKQKSGQLLRLNDDSYVAGLRDLNRRVHAETGTKMAPQLIHFLKIARSGYRQKVDDLELDYVRRLPAMFAEAAYRAMEAEFDAIELHFAHAYTMSSFLSRHNGRHDEYGGSVKKRLRLAEEVVLESRRAVGDAWCWARGSTATSSPWGATAWSIPGPSPCAWRNSASTTSACRRGGSSRTRSR